MTTQGSVKIKESVIDCITVVCPGNHRRNHTRFGGRIGHVEWDLKHVREAHPEEWAKHEPEPSMKCLRCPPDTEMNSPSFSEQIDTYGHYLVICFAAHGDVGSEQMLNDPSGMDTHGIFSPEELEFFDIDGLFLEAVAAFPIEVKAQRTEV